MTKKRSSQEENIGKIIEKSPRIIKYEDKSGFKVCQDYIFAVFDVYLWSINTTEL